MSTWINGFLEEAAETNNAREIRSTLIRCFTADRKPLTTKSTKAIVVRHHKANIETAPTGNEELSSHEQQSLHLPLAVNEETQQNEHQRHNSESREVASSETPRAMDMSMIPTLDTTPAGSSISPQKDRKMSMSSISRSTASSRISPRTVRLQSMSMRGTSRSSPRAHDNAAVFPERRRISYSVDDISHHALDRLGVNADILKKEKGMKKLGISDIDIALGEELRRYSGISVKAAGPATKAELIFGFTEEQLLRDKALKRLGTTEEEIMDDYSKRVSALGESEAVVAMH